MRNQLAEAAGRDVSREAFSRIELFVDLLRGEAQQQNLISAASIPHLWDRHILDSAQLLRFVPSKTASWCDIGSGAGLPGVVIAVLHAGPVTLIEPRRLRVAFLQGVVEQLALGDQVRIAGSKVEQVEGHFNVITGRAVAALPRFIELSHHLSTRNSCWVLPKGRNALSELAVAKRTWQGRFHVERSVTDADSMIVVATEVERKKR